MSIPNKRRLSVVGSIGRYFYDEEKIEPENERPEGTGEAEENSGHSGSCKAQQKNGLATDVIGKTAPLQHGGRFGDIVQGQLEEGIGTSVSTRVSWDKG